MSKEFKIGLITIVAGALLYYGFNYLRGSDLFSPANRFYATYKNVSGLNVSNPVYFNGLPVGRVSSFELVQEKGLIVVSLDIDEGIKIGKDASAALGNDGLFGGKAIILDVGSSSDFAEPGDTLNSKSNGDLISQFEPVADNLNTTITKLNDVLDKIDSTDIVGLVDTLKYSLASVTYKVAAMDVESILRNVDALIVSLKGRTDELSGLMASSNSLIDSLNALPLKASVIKLNETMDQLKNLMISVQSDKGSLGKMMSNDSVYNNLNKLLLDMDELVIHFNNYPKDFMKPLGRKHKKLKGATPEE